jgi:hypothetical protein
MKQTCYNLKRFAWHARDTAPARQQCITRMKHLFNMPAVTMKHPYKTYALITRVKRSLESLARTAGPLEHRHHTMSEKLFA